MDLKVILASLAFISITVAKRYCKINDDCTDLGELECIKSACEWGVCGCPYGQVSRFLGSSKLYRCVPLRKYDEKCSTDDDDGFCGALNSYCDEEQKRCRCYPGYVPIWGGERCIVQDEDSSVGAGETCSEHGLGECDVLTGMGAGSCSQSPSRIHQQVGGVPSPCACSNIETLHLYRQDHFQNQYLNPFVSVIEPGCGSKVEGDLCLKNSDCSGVANSECINNKCTCKSGYSRQYMGQYCRQTTTVLSKGEDCEINNNSIICDGSKGLVCGDICHLDVRNEIADNDGTCVCGPFHTESGGTCVARALGSSCYGDYNCRGISDIARCVDGKCEEK